jgi:hypothetical protein
LIGCSATELGLDSNVPEPAGVSFHGFHEHVRAPGSGVDDAGLQETSAASHQM